MKGTVYGSNERSIINEKLIIEKDKVKRSITD